jgi:hypothetical protein
MTCDLGSARHVLQLLAGQRQRLLDEAGHLQAPVGEIVGEQALIGIVVGRSDAVRPLRLADVGLAELGRQRVTAGQQALRAVGQAVGVFEEAAQAAADAEPAVEGIAAGQRDAGQTEAGGG